MNKPDTTSEIRHSRFGTTIVGPDAILYFRAVQLKLAIELYQKTGVIPTRGVGIRRMLDIAESIVEKGHYVTGKNGIKAAISDLEIWCSVMKSALPITGEES
jgi:hypothetical protein